MNCSSSRRSVVGEREEDGRAEEAEDGVDAAVVQEAEAAHLRRPGAGVVARMSMNADVRHAEHADLLVDVAQVRRS